MWKLQHLAQQVEWYRVVDPSKSNSFYVLCTVPVVGWKNLKSTTAAGRKKEESGITGYFKPLVALFFQVHQ